MSIRDPPAMHRVIIDSGRPTACQEDSGRTAYDSIDRADAHSEGRDMGRGQAPDQDCRDSGRQDRPSDVEWAGVQVRDPGRDWPTYSKDEITPEMKRGASSPPILRTPGLSTMAARSTSPPASSRWNSNRPDTGRFCWRRFGCVHPLRTPLRPLSPKFWRLCC